MPLQPPSYVPNPHLAYVWAQINGQDFINEGDKPQRLTGFTYIKRGADGGNYVQITVFDTEWTTVESILTASKKDTTLRFRYGYSRGIKSPTYEAIVTDYKPTFTIDGVQLTIEALSTGIVETKDFQKSRTFPLTAGKLQMEIHEIVQYIAEERGWNLVFDETKTKKSNIFLESAAPGFEFFEQNKMRDFQFIKDVLAPRAVRKKDGMADYKVYFEDNPIPTLHFHPPRYDSEPVIRIFEYMRDKMSEVISFSPDMSPQALLKLGAGTAACPYIDIQTGEFKDIFVNNENTPEKTSLGGKLTQGVDQDVEDYSIVESRPIRDEEFALDAARSRYFRMYNALLRADMTIQGDPRMNPHKIIQVNVRMPNGKFHYSSGLWYVMNVTDTISGGQFHTQMELQRSAYKKTETGITGDTVVGKVRE